MKDYNKNRDFEGLLRETKGKGRKKNYVLQFSGSASINDAQAMKDHIVEASNKKKPVKIDLSEITECDISLIQLLLSAGKSDSKGLFELARLPSQNPVRLNARIAGINTEKHGNTENDSLFGIILSDGEV